jgi:membrane protein DedA with SNARE-associated domain
MELLNIIETYILSAAHSIYNAWGWFGVAALLTFENATGITPSEIILGLAGWMLISEQQIPPSMIFLGGLFAAIGSVLGASITYWVARLGGRPLVDKLARWVRIDSAHIARAEKQFQRWGTGLVLVGRVMPGIRTLINIPAGLSCMPFTLFFVVTFIGSYVWCTLLIGAGYVLGNEWALVSTYLKLSLPYLLIGGFIALAIYFWFTRRSLALKNLPVQVDKG